MKNPQPSNDVSVMAEHALMLPGYELDGGSIIPPCRLGEAFVKFDGEWSVGPHGLACPACASLMSGPPRELDDTEFELEVEAELQAIAHQFTVLRMMLREADARRIELLVAGAQDRMRHGQF